MSLAVRPSWKAPPGQGVTFVELFFDLVFVFAVTGVAGLAIHDLTAQGIARAVLTFWLVWWAWTQVTWALNGADTTHPGIRFGTLAATLAALVMAVSVESAFEPDGGFWFVVPYVLVRSLGLILYFRVALGDQAWLSAVTTFATASLLGLAAALAGGLADPAHRAWWWLGTIALDFIAALVGGRNQGWNLQAPHFAERHGLFVIIALGESLLAVAVPASVSDRTTNGLLVLAVAAAMICLLWWTYFGWFKDRLEHDLAVRLGRREYQFARDAFSFMHFPLVVGIVGVAVGLEAIIAHPADRLGASTLAAFAAGLTLFVASTLPIWLRAGHGTLAGRVVFSLAMPVSLWFSRDQAGFVVVSVATLVLLGLVLTEARRKADPAP